MFEGLVFLHVFVAVDPSVFGGRVWNYTLDIGKATRAATNHSIRGKN
jgi:hypothetical protein